GEELRANLRGISCPTSSLCVAVDFSGGVWTSTNPAGGPGSWTPTKIPKARALFGVSCVSAVQCVVVGGDGLVITSNNPTGPRRHPRGGRVAGPGPPCAGAPAAPLGELHRDALRGELLQR